MTPFQKAFSSARNKLGADQEFDFQGKKYSTNTADDLKQLADSRARLQSEVASGGIVDKSGDIGEGVVESGKMTQDEFNKSFSTEKIKPQDKEDTMQGLSKLASALKPKDLGPAPEAYRFGDVGAGVQVAPNNMNARRAAIAKLSGGGIY